jgi:hypothetical protein
LVVCGDGELLVPRLGRGGCTRAVPYTEELLHGKLVRLVIEIEIISTCTWIRGGILFHTETIFYFRC